MSLNSNWSFLPGLSFNHLFFYFWLAETWKKCVLAIRLFFCSKLYLNPHPSQFSIPPPGHDGPRWLAFSLRHIQLLGGHRNRRRPGCHRIFGRSFRHLQSAFPILRCISGTMVVMTIVLHLAERDFKDSESTNFPVMFKQGRAGNKMRPSAVFPNANGPTDGRTDGHTLL